MSSPTSNGMMRRWHVQVTHPRYFGLFNPSVTLPSVIADIADGDAQPAAGVVADLAGRQRNRASHAGRGWRGKFGLPPSTIANFTTGGAEANLSAVVVALGAARSRQCGDGGLRSLPATPAIYLTGEAHDSFSEDCAGDGPRPSRAANGCHRRRPADGRGGLSRDRSIGDRRSGLDAADGRRHRRHDGGRRDRSARRHRAVLPVGAAVVSRRRAPGAARRSCRRGCAVHLDGIAAADSITCDAHKWFSVPMGAGMFFCRHPDAVRRRFPRAHRLHAARDRRSGRRSLRRPGPVVAAASSG